MGRLATGPHECFTSSRRNRNGVPRNVRTKVDPDRCEGHNRCFALAPDLFEVDDYGLSRALNDGVVPPGREEQARLAVDNCPEFAIDYAQQISPRVIAHALGIDPARADEFVTWVRGLIELGQTQPQMRIKYRDIRSGLP